jgi:tetratricopeptide (TPR) repeat protein
VDPAEGVALPHEASHNTSKRGVVTLGPYTLLEEIGHGNMGVVYRATKPGLVRDFALKVMLGEQDEESVQRFRLEAQVASKLNDRGIVAVFDIGTAQGRHYYVMDYCPGPTLAGRIKTEGRLDPEDAATILAKVARTMHRAHAKGVLHRDLKPANILLGESKDEHPRIADFGLAKDWTLKRNLTQTGDILGTPYYMSPEQFRGKGVDHSSDIWAMGVMLYECITGDRPFEGQDHIEVGNQVRDSIFAPPRKKIASIPVDLEAICFCALANDPANRYMSADAFAEDLEAYLRGDTPSHASGVASPGRSTGGPLKAMVLAALATATLVGIWWVSRPIESQGIDTAAGTEGPQTNDDGERARAALENAEYLARGPEPVADALSAFDRAAKLAQGQQPLASEVALARAAFLLRRGYPLEAAACVEGLRGGEGPLAQEAIRLLAQSQETTSKINLARRTYAELVRADPKGVRGLTALAATARLDARLGEASAAAERALAVDPDYVPALFERAAALLSTDAQANRTEVSELIQRGVALVPHDPRLVSCQSMTVGPAESIALLTRAISLSENRPESALLRARGTLVANTGDLDAGLKDLERAVLLSPNLGRSYMSRGLLYWEFDRREWENPDWLKRAEADIRRALDLDPNTFDRLVAVQPPRTQKAIRALLDGPSDRWAFGITKALRKRLEARAKRAQLPARKPLLRALLKAASGTPWSDLEALYLLAVRAAPDCPTVAMERVRVFVGREAYRHGFAEIERARTLIAKGGTRELTLDLLEADLWFISGRAYEAAPRLEDIYRREPETIEGLCARTRLLLAHERPYKAESASAEAVAFDPDHVPSLLARANTLTQRMPPQFDEAQELVDRALELNGTINVRALRLQLTCDQYRMWFKKGGPKKGKLQRTVTPKQIRPLVEAHERLFPLSAGNGFLLDGIQFLLMLTGKHPYHPKIEAWLEETIERQPTLGMNYVLVGQHQLQQRAPKETVLAAWRKARDVESRIRYSPMMLDVYRKAYGGPCPELAEFEDASKDPPK